MNYKILLMFVVLFSHAACVTSSQIDQDVALNRFFAPSNDSKALACVQEAICGLVNKLDCLQSCEDLCAATVITEAGILTESGIYCLGNDVVGTIIIVGSSITLNLNGHMVLSGSDGIAVAATASDVRIRNGSVRGSEADRGIFINGATNVRIEDVTCENWDTGIHILDSGAITIDQVICNANCSTGLLVENSTAIVARDSSFNQNTAGVLTLDGSIVELINCSATGFSFLEAMRQRDIDSLNVENVVRACGEGQVGFLCNNATMVCRDCSAFNCAGGFIGESGQTDLLNSIAEGNFLGFGLFGDQNTATNCIAENNIDGFVSDPDQGEAIFRDCMAKDNDQYGFFETDVATDNAQNMYLNCVACNNGTNYSSNIVAANNAPVTSAANARGFDNVDCSDTTPDLLAAMIQSLLG